ncbi:MAG: GNAT family N-acetyltransferase [Candidatus Bathyarchaeia archaeon]
MKTVKVRSFLNGDEKVVAHIHNMAFAEWIESLGKEYDYRYVTPKDVLAWIEENHSKHESLWIAEMDGEAVGYTHCHFEEIHGKKDFKELLFVHTSGDMGQSKIAVIPKHRHQGVAKALIQKCVEHFETLGANLATVATYSDNKVAEKLLQQLSFVHQQLFYYKPYSDKKPWRYDNIYAELDLSNPVKPPLRLNQDIKIRRAREEDAKDVAEVFRKSAPWSPFGPNASTDQILRHYLKSASHETIFVAEDNRRVVGVMDFNNDNNRLGIPGVLPEYRKKGIGYTLFYHLLKHMRQKGFSKAIADTGLILPDPIKMYTQFGFKIIRRQHAWIKILQ